MYLLIPLGVTRRFLFERKRSQNLFTNSSLSSVYLNSFLLLSPLFPRLTHTHALSYLILACHPSPFPPSSFLLFPYPYPGPHTLVKAATSFREEHERVSTTEKFPALPGIEPGISRISIRYADGSPTLVLYVHSMYIS